MNHNQATSGQDPPSVLASDGEMGQRTRVFDWSKTPVGPVSDWPQSLKTAVRIILNSRYPMFVWWGRRLTNFYNDAYTPMLGKRHPDALGRPAAEVWSDVWPVVGPQTEAVLNEGRATWNEEKLLVMERNGFMEEAYFTFSYSPLPDDDGSVGGVFCAVTEDTPRVLSQRRLRTLRELAARTTEEAKSVEAACQTAARILAENPYDIPFALIYLLDADAKIARLAGSTGLPDRSLAAAPCVDLVAPDGAEAVWPLGDMMNSGRAEVVTDLGKRFGLLPGGAWPEPTEMALVVPMAKSGKAQLAGFIVAGVSPRLELNEAYRTFYDLLAVGVSTAVANARAYEEERRRAEALTELDRAKTTFFCNVSHEFRTPLTLILSPLEDALAETNERWQRDRLELIHRNALRLQKLVNTLLDFSRIEAGRIQACYEPTDLAMLTGELASVFRSAVEKAGMRLVVDCAPLSEPVYVDRDMYEKIVLNLLSNAFKFTLEGEIEVTLRERSRHAVRNGAPHVDDQDSIELRVRDTGTGIAEDQLPHIFQRFHRIEGARARTHEGTGIGLALVQELVKLHGGSVNVESAAGKGSTFTVTLLKGKAHLPGDHIGGSRQLVSSTQPVKHFVEEALRWLPSKRDRQTSRQADKDRTDGTPVSVSSLLPGSLSIPASRPRIVWADDNADMRKYVCRLLAPRYDVEDVADGEAALVAVHRQAPDLVLTDVMMPGLDGFGLLRALRADERTRTIPVILLSARAGEEAQVEGMQAGADDYLVKPFKARELLARVSAHIGIARLRRETEAQLRTSEERYRAMLDALPAAIYMTDAAGKITHFNSACIEFSGRTPSLGTDHWCISWKLYHPDGTPMRRDECPMAIALKEGRIVRGTEAIAERPDGSRVWFAPYPTPLRDAEGRVVGGINMLVDITERKQAEQTQARLAAIVASSDDAIISKDLNSIIMSWNAGAERIFGYTAEEAIGRAVTMLMPPDRVDEEPGILDCIRRGQGVKHYETVRRRKDGTLLDISLTVSPIVDGQGRIIGASKIARDITARKQAEQALRDSDRRKDDFLATLAHELRNPLAPVMNSLEMLQRVELDEPVAVEARDTMQRQLKHMVRLVDDLMDVSRISLGKIDLKKQRVELAPLIRHAAEASRLMAESAEQLVAISIPQEPIDLDGDPARLAQVFGNLLNNACRYSGRGSQIELAARRDGSEVIVSVKDNGIGIPPEKLEEIFDMFSQVDRSLERATGGLGIGLHLVKRFVELHGGSVRAHSGGMGMGSEFVVRLPIVVEKAGSGPSSPPATDGATATARRVLVVDDNRDSARTLALLLKMTGNEAEMAHDGEEAVAKAATFSPDVVLLDIGLPKLNGYEACREIRKQPRGKDIVLVALTGWGQEEDRRKSREAGFDEHFVKPVDHAALTRLLRDLRPSRV